MGATIAKLLGMKSLVIRTTLKHVFIPLLGQAKQGEGVALVGGKIGASVRKTSLWLIGRCVEQLLFMNNHHPHSLVFLH
jgi:hypothetical protein